MKKYLKNLNLKISFYIIAICIILNIIMKKYFSDIYLIEWLFDNSIYIFVYILSFVLLILGKKQLAKIILSANFIGIPLGIFLGNIINIVNTKKITETMSNEQIYRLSTRYDVFIWIGTILLSIIILIISKSIINIRKNVELNNQK